MTTNNSLNNSSSPFDVNNLHLETNTISSTDTNGNIILNPDGTGDTNISSGDLNVLGGSVSIDPGAATDSFIQLDESTTGKWRLGNDATDDSFRISQGSALGTNDTFIMSVDGERTMPLQPAFLAVLETTDTDVTGAGSVYLVGTNTAYVERFDQGGDFVTSPCTFTAPIDGKYQLNFNWAFQGMDSNMTSMSNRIITSNETFNVCRENPWEDRNTDTGRTSQCGVIFCEMDAADTSTYQVQISGSLSGDDADLSNAQSSNAVSGWLVV